MDGRGGKGRFSGKRNYARQPTTRSGSSRPRHVRITQQQLLDTAAELDKLRADNTATAAISEEKPSGKPYRESAPRCGPQPTAALFGKALGGIRSSSAPSARRGQRDRSQPATQPNEQRPEDTPELEQQHSNVEGISQRSTDVTVTSDSAIGQREELDRVEGLLDVKADSAIGQREELDRVGGLLDMKAVEERQAVAVHADKGCLPVNDEKSEVRNTDHPSSAGGKNVEYDERKRIHPEKKKDVRFACVQEDTPKDEFKQILDRFNRVERQLKGVLSRGVELQRGPEIFGLSHTTRELGKRLMLHNHQHYTKLDIDQRLWRHSCYEIIEAFRPFCQLPSYPLSRTPAPPVAMAIMEARSLLLAFVQYVSAFYSSLIKYIQRTKDFTLNEYVRLAKLQQQPRSKVKLAALTCHRTYLYLGDLARYEQQLTVSQTWGLARSYYLKAQQLAPRNGKSYNQLAVLAVYTRRKLDAIFYYMRSLAVSTPILTARERLLALFEDIRKKNSLLECQAKRKVQTPEQKEDEGKSGQACKNTVGKSLQPDDSASSDVNDHVQTNLVEVWIHPDSKVDSSAPTRVTEEKRDKPKEMKHEDEMKNMLGDRRVPVGSAKKKHATLRFLRLHGMLFTKIGMEQFSSVSAGFLAELKCVLASPAVDITLLVKMMVVNIFSLNHIQANSPALAAQAYYLLTAFYSLLVDACLMRAKQCAETPYRYARDLTDMPSDRSAGISVTSDEERQDCNRSPQESKRREGSATSADCDHCHASKQRLSLRRVSAELSALLPALWVWSAFVADNWSEMLLNRSCPQPWSAMCQLLNIMASWSTAGLQIPPESCADAAQAKQDLLSLPEDQLVAAFAPIQNTLSSTLLCAREDDTELAVCQFSTRFKRVLLCGERISSTAKSPLQLVVVDSLAQFTLSKGNIHTDEAGVQLSVDMTMVDNGSSSEEEEESEDEDVIVIEEYEESVSTDEEDTVEESALSDQIQQLKARKDSLLEKLTAQELYKEQVQEVMAEQSSAPDVELCIEPRYLIPDTNCFVRFLAQLRLLLDCCHFTMVVPLVVVNELYGLKKGSRDDDIDGHAPEAQVAARAAIEFLEEQFAAKNRFLRGITSKGSLMSTISFRHEEPTAGLGNNDDTILNCAVQLCDQRPPKLDKERNVQQVSCRTVLLTDDRNLRVKAHARLLPTRDITSFVQWLHG